MAQYTVTAGCGHTTTLQLYGPSRDREQRIAWMRSPTGKCNSCYAASKRDEADHARELEVQRYAKSTLDLLDRCNPAERAASIRVRHASCLRSASEIDKPDSMSVLTAARTSLKAGFSA